MTTAIARRAARIAVLSATTITLAPALLLPACSSTPAAPSCGADTCSCASDDDCQAPTPRCDRNGGQCVACLPLHDNCGAGKRCIDSHGTFACAVACLADADCAASGAAATCCGGLCVDTRASATNCGACGRQCPASPHAAPACLAGACGLGACDPGFGDCDGKPEDGCEQDLTADPLHCGACGTACRGPDGGGAVSCVASRCRLACPALRGDCDGDPGNGCESDLGADDANCGGCGRACAVPSGGAVACKAGRCQITSCPAGRADCNGQAFDGCEASVDSDVANCGGCGKACAAANATSVSCAGGRCGIGGCLDGYGDCDGDPATGCEAALRSDPANCGACGAACAPPDSVGACVLGACEIVGCPPGRADCDHQAGNGCEQPITDDSANCGGCGQRCPGASHASGACASGQCRLACDAGFGDCNASPIDGCERDLLGDVASCGACGRACSLAHATSRCAAGQCAVAACDAGWDNCDGKVDNGCEVDLTRDAANCGRCGQACALAHAASTCAGGRCQLGACRDGFEDCDGRADDGCEVDLAHDPTSCGACGFVCPAFVPACTARHCTPLFQPDGVLTDVPEAWLGGWVRCFTSSYAAKDNVDDLLTACGKIAGVATAKLLVACRPAKSATFTVLAQGRRSDALFDTGAADDGQLHEAGGVGWYYDAAWSWGFAPPGASVRKAPCDDALPPNQQPPDAASRLCWPTDCQGQAGSFVAGGRCGAQAALADPGWERVVYQAF